MSLTNSFRCVGLREVCGSRSDRWIGGLVLALFAAALLPQPVIAADLRPAVQEHVKQATVYVWTYRSERSQADTPLSTGSGFFINRTGLAITNNHVVDPTHGKSPIEKFKAGYEGGKLSWKVVLNSGTDDEKTYEAAVLYQNEPADQALLQIYDEDGGKLHSPNFLRLLPESRLRKLEETWSLGFPGGDRQASSGKGAEVQIEKGNIIDLPRTPGGRLRMIYTDALVRPGNSGGPCVTRDGFLVGTVTLMKPPEGREDTGGARYSALVPAKLTGEIVRNAFLLGKIDKGTDFSPFMESVTNKNGLVNISEFARREDNATLYFENGDRYLGTIKTETIHWKSSLGEFSIPSKAIAYIMHNEDGADLYLERGNRFSGETLEGEFKFQERAGEEFSVAFSDVSVIAFGTAGHGADAPSGETVVFDTDACHLILESIEGEAAFKSRLGKRSVSLDQIDRIETNDDDKQVLTMLSGSRITGQFDSQPVRAKLAGLDTNLALNLSDVKRASVERRKVQADRLDGLDMRSLYADARLEIRDIAKMLDTDVEGASTAIKKWTDKVSMRKLTQADQDRVRVLNAMIQLRSGHYDAAIKSFRSVSRSEERNLATYAAAHMEILKKTSGYKYEGKPLSDPMIFARAARSITSQYLSQTRDFLKDARQTKVERRGIFPPLLYEAKRQEKLMEVAAVVHGSEAEDLLIRVWKAVIDKGVEEIERIQKDQGQSGRGGGSHNNRRGGQGVQLDLEGNPDLRRAYESVIAYVGKRFEYGFHIEDPDADSLRDERSPAGD
jgi:S1-C subfamily serine protease